MFEFFLGFHATVDRIFSIYVALLSDSKISSRVKESFPFLASLVSHEDGTQQ